MNLRKKDIIHKPQKFDIVFVLSIFLLTIIGLLFVYSASYYTALNQTGNKFFYLTKQVIGFLIGVVAFFVSLKIKQSVLKKMAIPLLVVSVIMLILVFVPGLSRENYGAKRWIGIGGFTFQPSEIAKFSLVLFCAWYYDKKNIDTGKFLHLLPILSVGGLLCVLIILEPNMSITVCVGLVMLIMIFICGAKLKHFLLLFFPLLLTVPALIFMEPYRLKRLLAFLDPWATPKDEGYQLIQSLYALGSGGWFGVGYLNSRQKYSFLPFAESDFVFSVVGEETGLIGCFFVLLLFVVIVAKGAKTAINAKNKFDSVLAGGITAVIGVQAVINFAVVTGLIPPTGLPLPFVSYGGTSLVVFLTASGVLFNIDLKNKSSQKYLNNTQKSVSYLIADTNVSF